MEQMYLIEVFIDSVCVFVREDDPRTNIKDKNLFVLVRFGTDFQFIIKEALMANTPRQDTNVETDEKGNNKWCRTFRVGKSYLFPSYAEVVFEKFENYPLDLELWTDDQNEKKELIGCGKMIFDTRFYGFLLESFDYCAEYDVNVRTRAIKEITTLFLECCCVEAGQIGFIFRISALGDTITTDFQQLVNKDPNDFLFRTDKAPSTYQVKRIEPENSKFKFAGSIYQEAIDADPDVMEKLNKIVDVCTQLQSCGITQTEGPCDKIPVGRIVKQYNYNKFKMGDITGPCGNINCTLAHKVKTYIRHMDGYKKKAANMKLPEKQQPPTNEYCGQCSCRHSKYYRDSQLHKENKEKPVCTGCGGVSQDGQTCADRIIQMHGTGLTPKQSLDKIAELSKKT